jgi:hypothetical protein
MKTFTEILKENTIDQPHMNYNSYIGYASISFRSKKYNDDVNRGPNYILNEKGDTWFRSREGNSKGYGLCIRSVKVTGRKAETFGNFKVYKANMDWLNNQDEEIKAEPIWIVVHENFDLDDVLNYIKKNSHKWVP